MLDHLTRHTRLAIFPGKSTFPCSYAGLYDAAYQFWVTYWQATRREVGLPEGVLHSDDFLRHDLVNVLLYKENVIGMINCTILDFSLAASQAHSYVQAYFDDSFRASVRSLGLKRMATLENIFLDPAWRSSRVGFSLGAVLMANALRKSREVGCDGIFGAPRKDAPTSRICSDLGARVITRDLVFHGKPTELSLWKVGDIKAHPQREVNALAEHLWSNQLDVNESSAGQEYKAVA